jgi:hypothetical protein
VSAAPSAQDVASSARCRESYRADPGAICRNHLPPGVGPIGRCCSSVGHRMRVRGRSELTLPRGHGKLGRGDRHGGRIGGGCGKSAGVWSDSRLLHRGRGHTPTLPTPVRTELGSISTAASSRRPTLPPRPACLVTI